jgi:hypothetical protein
LCRFKSRWKRARGWRICNFEKLFDFEGIGPIESDVEPCDEVQAFCDLVKDALFQGKKRAEEMKVSDYALKMVATYKE